MKIILSRKGFDLLKYDVKRVLTLKNATKATWQYNEVFDKAHLYETNGHNTAKDKTTGIYYAGIWQELCLLESEKCEAWAKYIIC